MKRFTVLATISLGVFLIAAGCGKKENEVSNFTIPEVVTADIQAGIEKHIEEHAAQNQGFYKLPFKEDNLSLKLVRVHTEYLANLGPGYHFACVDLAGEDGTVYDVDFFMKGDPGNMEITESTVHKINGQPLYAWEQKPDRTWARVPMDAASSALLGVIEGADEFEFTYKTTIPEIITSARMWVPVPSSDRWQNIENLSINTPGKQKIIEDEKFKNKALYLELGPEDSNKTFEMKYLVKRKEVAAYEEKGIDPKQFLEPERLVPMNNRFKETADNVLKGKKGELVKARALYDYIIDNMKYIKNGEGWGQGNALFACDSLHGNCTDFHSYFIALARAAGIPARFMIGAGIPSSRNDGGISGYHCWAEFYAEGKWWPVDISEADKYTALATYYFGHHPANRVEFSRGRDLVFDPGPASGPVNFFAYPIFETEGRQIKIKPKFTFVRTADHLAAE